MHTTAAPLQPTWTPATMASAEDALPDETLRECRERAEAESIANGYCIAWALNNDLIVDDSGPTDVAAACRDGYYPSDRPAAELLAVIVGATDSGDIRRAARELRERLLQAPSMLQHIADREAELVAEAAQWSLDHPDEAGDESEEG